jgi:DNA-binding LacI/PurR family transcriptional regulator
MMNGFSHAGAAPEGPRSEAAANSPRRLSDLQKTITMAQIAKAAGVSQGAISSLLNDRDYGIRVSEKTRERVFKVCREMGYIPNDLRAVVRMYPELGDTCILISDEFRGGILHPWVGKVVQTALQFCAPHTVTLSNYNRGIDYTRELDSLPEPIQAGVASKFILAGHPNPTLAQAIIRRGLPLSCLGADLPMEGVRSFVPDTLEACKTALTRLTEAGHRRISFFHGVEGSDSFGEVGVTQFMWKAAETVLGDGHSWVVSGVAPGFDGGLEAYDAMIRDAHGSTAAVFLSDEASLGFISAVKAAGGRIPEDFSVVSVDAQCAGLRMQPQISAARSPLEQMTMDAVGWVNGAVRAGLLNESGKQVYQCIWDAGSTIGTAS